MKGQPRNPIYNSRASPFEIDSCRPQLAALSAGKIELHALSKGHYPGKRIPVNILPGLTSVGFWDCRGSQDWGLDLHRNEGLEIVYLETGGTAFEVEGCIHKLQADNITITRPWQLHRLGDPNIGRGRLFWLILDVGVRRSNQAWRWPSWTILAPDDLAALTRRLRQVDRSVWQANPRVREIFRDIGHCVLGWSEPWMASRLGVAVNRLLVELLDIVSDERAPVSSEQETRRRTVELLLLDLARDPVRSAEPWTLDSMSSHCGMGVTAMTKYCRELVNNGPMAYLNLCRLEHAASLLRAEPSLSVTEVAMRSGFNSSQYFATCFRKRYRTTPLGYRFSQERLS